jgi:hypothetical protein
MRPHAARLACTVIQLAKAIHKWIEGSVCPGAQMMMSSSKSRRTVPVSGVSATDGALTNVQESAPDDNCSLFKKRISGAL